MKTAVQREDPAHRPASRAAPGPFASLFPSPPPALPVTAGTTTPGWGNVNTAGDRTTTPLQPLPSGPRPGLILAGRIWQKRRLIAQATAAKGRITTVILLSPTARPHRHSFQPEGFWLQTGGVFGQSARQGPRLRLISFRRRIAEEAARISPYRPIA